MVPERREHRGHRLGVAVKVANLRLLQRERPDITRLTTYNAEVNSHMIGVNEALGFRPLRPVLLRFGGADFPAMEMERHL